MMAWPTPTGKLGRPAKALILILVSGMMLGCWAVGLTPSNLLASAGKVGDVFSRIFVRPDLAMLPKLSMLFLETLAMGLVASFLAAAIAGPLAFLASSRTTPFKPLALLLKAFFSLVRAIPDLVWAIAFVSAFGLGPAAGIAALTVTTLAFLVKFHYESLDVAPLEPERGVQAHGAGWLATRLYGVLPSAMPDWISQWIYSVDSNVRSASILGFVGAGGIGFEFADCVRLSRYDRLGVIVFGIFLIVAALDAFGDWARRRMA